MSFKDDDDDKFNDRSYGYEDDDDEGDPDDRYRSVDDDDDEDESLGGSSGNRFGIKPSGGLPGAGQSRFGGGGSSGSSSSPFSRPAGSGSGSSSSSSSPFGGNRPSSGSSFGGGSSSSSGSGSSGAFGSNRPAGSGSFGGGGSSSSSSGSGSSGAFGGNRPSTGSLGGSSSSSSGSGSSGSSSFGGNRPGGGSSSSSSSSSSPFGGNRPSTGSLGGSSSSSSGAGSSGSFGGNRPSTGSLGGSSSSSSSSSSPARPAFGGGSGSSGGTGPLSPAKPSPAKSDDRKDDKASGGGLGGMLGGITGRFGGGAKADDKKDAKPGSIGGLLGGKKDDKKDDKASGGGLGGMLGGITGRFGGGAKADDKKDAKPAPKKDDKPAGGGMFGSITSRFGGGAKPDDKKDAKPAASGGAGSSGGAFGGGAFGGNRPAATTIGSTPTVNASAASAGAKGGAFPGKAPTDAKASAPKAESGGGFFSSITSRFRREPAAAKPTPPARPRTSKAPVIESEDGLTLDNWLDIIGVLLVFGAFVLMVSALSAEQAAIRGFLNFFGELFGWGAFIAPLTMLVIGVWLIVRHFGDQAPSIDPIRVAGIVLAFIALLIVFQYVDSFSYDAFTTPGLLEKRLEYSWQTLHAGGGAVGAQLYYFLIRNVTEIGGVLVVILMLVIAAMLFTRSSASQMLTTGVGMGRSARESVQRRAAAQRARQELERERRAQLAAQQAPVPATANAAPFPVQAAPSAPDPSVIRINRGVEAAPAPTVAPVMAQVAAPPPPVSAPEQAGGGFLSRFRGNNAPAATNNTGIRGRFGRNDTREPAPPPLITPLPLDDEPLRPAFGTSNSMSGLASERPQAAPLESAFSPFERPAAPAPMTPAPNFAPPPSMPPPSPSYSFADDEDDEEESREIVQRTDRLNALRSGMTQPAQPARPEPSFAPPSANTFVPPSQLPSAQPSAKPAQEALSIPMSSAVVNQTRAQRPQWKMPDYRTLLSSGSEQEFDRELLLRQAKMIEDTLTSFGAPGRVVEVNTGPVITQFGVEPDYVNARGKKQRVKVGAIAALDKDLQLALGAKSIRVEAPVPGKGYVGIEVPNKEPATVRLRDVMESPGFLKVKSPLAIALGQSVSGAPISADLASMPHLLIAGTTGSGKSVMVNAIISSIISRNTPDTVKFIMVDPKRVELTGYNGIPHLVAPVVVELERIIGVLKWVTREMDDRYKKFSDAGSRNIEDYNKHLDESRDRMPYIVVIIDELADLMMLAPEETERTITRIAALARATGIHLVIATQRPSVDVVTGLIKANFPARIAFAVASGVDSRVILDQPGAEKLLGRGDMLYLSGDTPAPQRLQGVFLSDMEINNLVRYWKVQAVDTPGDAKPFNTSVANEEPVRLPSFHTSTVVTPAQTPAQANASASFWEAATSTPTAPRGTESLSQAALTGDSDDEDDMYEQSVELVRRLDKASVSLLQRRLRIGYTRAARLIDMMEARGVVGPAKDGSSKPRDVLLNLGEKKPT